MQLIHFATTRYTDGTKTKQGTDFGKYWSETDYSFYDSLEQTATVFQSEINHIILQWRPYGLQLSDSKN